LSELNIITLTYDFAKYLAPIVSRFPRNVRYQLGERIEGLVFGILDSLLTAKYSREKKAILFQTNIQLEKLRFFVRLAVDLHFISVQRHGVIASQINAIGNQLGGWLKSVNV
jgi:hypothetical protein